MASNLQGTTLLDMVNLEKPSLRKAIMKGMFTSGLPSPIEYLPVENAQSLTQQSVRLTDAGSPTTRNLGEAVATYAATFTKGEETLKIIENKITIDKVLLDVKTYVQDPIALQTQQYAETVKLTANNLFLAGDPGLDPSDPAGLDYRLRNDALFLQQSVDANALDVDANNTTIDQWISHIDDAIVRTQGQTDMIIVNRQTWLRFRAVLRTARLLDTTQDQFDRKVTLYGGIPLIDAGQTPAGAVTGSTSNQIIPDDTSTSIFDDANTTPMYFCVTKSEGGVKLLQLHPLRTTKVGIDTSDPGVYVVDVTWPIGFLVTHKFALSSVQGLNIT